MPEPRAAWTNSLLKALGSLLGAVLLAAALLPLIEAAGAMPAVSRLEIAGEFKHLDAEQVRERLRPHLSGSLLSLDLEGLRVEAESLPWIARARVERLWPDAIRLSLIERVAHARWGEHALLTEDGIEFAPDAKTLPEGLPRLSGPRGQEQAVLQAWGQIASALATGDFAVVQLDLDARGEWTARTAAGIELRFGRGDPLPKTTVVTGAVQRALAARLAEIAYVDLRYSNGFAVGWRESAGKGEKP